MAKLTLGVTLILSMFAMLFFSVMATKQLQTQVFPFAFVAAASAVGLGMAALPDDGGSRTLVGTVLVIAIFGMLFFSFGASRQYAWHAAPFAFVAGGAALGLGFGGRRGVVESAQSTLGVVLVVMVLAMVFFAIIASRSHSWQTAPFGFVAAMAAIGIGLAGRSAVARV